MEIVPFPCIIFNLQIFPVSSQIYSSDLHVSVVKMQIPRIHHPRLAFYNLLTMERFLDKCIKVVRVNIYSSD